MLAQNLTPNLPRCEITIEKYLSLLGQSVSHLSRGDTSNEKGTVVVLVVPV